jgi:hypothetical protein
MNRNTGNLPAHTSCSIYLSRLHPVRNFHHRRNQNIPYTSAPSEHDDEITRGLLTVLPLGCTYRLYNETCDGPQSVPHLWHVFAYGMSVLLLVIIQGTNFTAICIHVPNNIPRRIQKLLIIHHLPSWKADALLQISISVT